MRAIFILFFVFNVSAVFAQTAKPLKHKKMRGAVIVFETDTIDFGEIWEGEKAEAEFKFKNEGSQPLMLTEVITTCGCTNAVWPKEAIPAGGTGSIKVAYDSQFRPGVFMKKIGVRSNAKNANVKIIVITGNVIKPAIPPAH
ncbi:MAG: DUF1573 domain-containing protein [Bacteroidia bacterium]|nr:DUF1573 domain-containing protein [Bacteroidia bacterium]